jgi:hypothetical protein
LINQVLLIKNYDSRIKNSQRMIKPALQLLDEFINDIKQLTINKGYNKFEFYLILSLEIVRYEIFTTEHISDLTAGAVSQLFAFQTHEFYYREYPEIYEKSSKLFFVLLAYNEKLRNHDLSGTVGVKDKNWIRYFEKSISNLIDSNKPNNK